MSTCSNFPGFGYILLENLGVKKKTLEKKNKNRDTHLSGQTHGIQSPSQVHTSVEMWGLDPVPDVRKRGTSVLQRFIFPYWSPPVSLINQDKVQTKKNMDLLTHPPQEKH